MSAGLILASVLGVVLSTEKAQPSVGNLLVEARGLFGQLEYDRVIPIAEAVLARADANEEERFDAFLLQASCLAIVGDTVRAEVPFRLLLRARPDFDLPADTSPKILAVFRKVQAEERTIADEVKALERQQIIKEMAAEGEPVVEARGGTPIPFEYRLRDPRGLVEEVVLGYRRAGVRTFASIGFERHEGGVWRTAIPGEWTVNDDGFQLEYYVSTRDAKGRELLHLGDAAAPLALPVLPGDQESSTPFYGRGWFIAAAAAVVAGAGVATFLIVREAGSIAPSDLGEVPYRP